MGERKRKKISLAVKPKNIHVTTLDNVKVRTKLIHFIPMLPIFVMLFSILYSFQCSSCCIEIKGTLVRDTVQKLKFSIKDIFSKCYQIGSFLGIWSHLLKKSLMETFFCAVKNELILILQSTLKSFMKNYVDIKKLVFIRLITSVVKIFP